MGEDEFISMLNKFTDEELEEELKRRKFVPKHLPLKEVNVSLLYEQVKAYIDSIHQNGYPEKDAEHFIFETTMKIFYGPDIYKWINEHNLGR